MHDEDALPERPGEVMHVPPMFRTEAQSRI